MGPEATEPFPIHIDLSWIRRFTVEEQYQALARLKGLGYQMACEAEGSLVLTGGALAAPSQQPQAGQ